MAGSALVWDLLVRGNAPEEFTKTAAAADKAAAAMDRTQKTSIAAGAKMSAVGAKLTKSVTLPLLGLGAVAVDQAAKFQKATSVYVTAAGESAKNLGTIQSGIKKIATTTGTSIDQLTAAEYAIEKAGLHGAGGLKLLQAASEGASEENANLSDVVQGATSVMASYHLSTDKSVQVINALKTGAGTAKTTFEAYVRSLSTVIPVASAAGISLQQTLGAISTLTQHGTSADEATQELAFTIRSLQAPNNVASKAMQQLGLNVVNVEKNLGKRGLTGTIDLLTTAIEKKMGPSGLVAVNAFKQSQSASADLTLELSKMPKPLADISKQFESGKLGYKDYLGDVKNLGGAQYELGKNFISTVGQAKGFNNLLAAGNPAAQTFAAYLKSVTGGATGLNTALQLGGKNLDGFKARTTAIGKSLDDTSTSVEGWARTSQLASTHAAEFKNQLQVLAIDAGDKLLPMFTGLVTKAQGVVNWFSNLSHGTKEVIGYSTLLVAALGPVLAIVGRLVTAYGYVVKAGAAVWAGASRLVGYFTTTGTAATASAAETAAAAATVAQAEADKAAATAEAAVNIAASLEGTNSVLAASASEAAADAIEFSAAMQAQADAAAAMAGEVETSSAAAGEASSLALGPIGIAIGAVGIAAALGASKLGLFGKSAASQVASVQSLTSAIQEDSGALGKNALAAVSNGLEKSGALDAARTLGLNLHQVAEAALNGGPALKGITGELKYLEVGAYGAGKGTQAQINAAEKLSSVLGATNGNVQKAVQQAKNLKDANGGLAKSSDDASTAVKKTAINLGTLGNLSVKPGVSVNTATANTQIALIQKTIDAIKQGKVPLLAANSAPGIAQIQKLQAEINALHQGHEPTLAVNNTEAISAIEQAQNMLNAIHDKTVSVTVVTQAHGAGASTTIGGHHAAGGRITGPGSGTSDSIPAMLSNGEFVVNARATSQNLGLLHAINSGVQRFANGGGPITTTTVGGSKKWVYDGINYASLATAQNARTKANKSTYSVGGQSYDSLAAITKAIAKALAVLPRDFHKLSKAVNGSGSDVRSAFADLLATAKSAGISKANRLRLTRMDNVLAADVNARDRAATRLKTLQGNANQLKSGIAQASRGGFDITTAGTSASGAAGISFGNIAAQAKQAAIIEKKFSIGLRRLRKEGLALAVVTQLAQAGPSAYPQVAALLKATPKQLRALNSDESYIGAVGSTLGGYVAGQKYGGKNGPIAKARTEEKRESAKVVAKLESINTSIQRLEHRPVKVEVRIGGRKIATEVATGNRKNGRRAHKKTP